MKFSEYLAHNNEALSLTHTGGNCTAVYGELNTKQDHILITGGDCTAPTDTDTEFLVGVYLNDFGEPAHTFTTTNVDHLAEIVAACYTLWGN